MKFPSKLFGRSTKLAVIPVLTLALSLTGFGLAGGNAAAQEKTKIGSAKKTDQELKAIAVAAVPGKAVDVAIERKLGANRYVVEVLSIKDGGAEVDVIIDTKTYRVIGIDK